MIDDILKRLEPELQWSFARSGGPGGQNVNKVSTKALLRWKVAQSEVLPADWKHRLMQRLSQRLTKEGDLLISSQKYRDQPRNMEDCRSKLMALLLQVQAPPVPRKRTRPTQASKLRRQSAKEYRAQRKAGRRSIREE